MEDYKAKCREILRRYRAGEITRDVCINMLDAAIVGILPTLTPEQMAQLRNSQLYEFWDHRLTELTARR